MIDKQNIIERFVKYVKIDTESDPNNSDFPSTTNQWDLAKVLEAELKAIGMQNVELDKNCYLMATLPSNINYEVPTIGFISHMDTSPDFTGKNVNPQIIENYDGEDIVLNQRQKIILQQFVLEMNIKING